jgi:hypothetical protein
MKTSFFLKFRFWFPGELAMATNAWLLGQQKEASSGGSFPSFCCMYVYMVKNWQFSPKVAF